MLERVNQVMVDSEREVCGSVREERKIPKSERWNGEVKDVLGARERKVKKDLGNFIRRKRENL